MALAPADDGGITRRVDARRTGTKIAAVVPCHNESPTVADVVRSLREAVPGIEVYVYDNNSTDDTAEAAKQAGAIVRREAARGKGNVVRRAFADVEADIYVLVDGDGTYDASRTGEMIDLLRDGPYDHVLGVRTEISDTAFRPGHTFGNKLFNRLVGRIFGARVDDMLSGFRVFSRRFVKSFPAVSREFEIETELTVHAMNLRVPQEQVKIGFRDRPDGSESKLRTYHDGWRILWLIAELARHERPLLYHGAVTALLLFAGLALGIPVVSEFAETGAVPRLPTAVLSSSFVILALIALVAGLILDGLRRTRREQGRLAYLNLPCPPHDAGRAP
ncbi:glycosyltransferase [Saccharopolyspora sp. HNM0983]|uniref:Glycosyltransferase n=1 Tax=Saccharopolyspora montiporae TaxID=2781240 RepID=A0A929BA19_9PSEU|nr:glycosyltransferase [Saccharopolyspora sp. HNM0983]